jgi:hypothetical protein
MSARLDGHTLSGRSLPKLEEQLVGGPHGIPGNSASEMNEVPNTKEVSKVDVKESRQGRLAVSRRPSEGRGLAGSDRGRLGTFRGLGTAVLVLAVLLLVAGGASLVGAAAQRSDGGYFTTPGAWFSSPTAALITEEIDVGSGQPADPAGDAGELARVRIRVHSADPTIPIFVGVGPSDAVHAYLAGTAHEEFAGASFEPFHATFRRVSGAARADPPAAQPFWVATSVGSGPRTLEWDKSRGAYSLVVMRANGAPGLDVFGDVGLRFGFLVPLGIGLVSAALVVLVLAGALRRRPLRRRLEVLRKRRTP